MSKLSKHFDSDEFRCKCCGGLPAGGISKDLIELLEQIREAFGKSITITSGYRCEYHNKKVGGAKRSQHIEGIAADFKVTGVPAHTVHAYIVENLDSKVGGLGKYKDWTHIDTRKERARWAR
jgi:uncharacterized protein YcbK (DUF882 family)